MSDKAPNYTDAQVAMLREMAPISFDRVNEVAAELGKDPRSVRAKLIRMQNEARQVENDDSIVFYIPKPKAVTKTGEPVVTKAELVKQIASLVRVEASSLESLDKASKAHLKNLLAAVTPSEDSEDVTEAAE